MTLALSDFTGGMLVQEADVKIVNPVFLANGSQGVVCSADFNGQRVAVKEMKKSPELPLGKIELRQARFDAEAVALLRIQGLIRDIKEQACDTLPIDVFPDLKAILLDTNHRCSAIVMELLESKSLKQLVADEYDFSLRDILDLGKSLASAAHYLANLGYVYRDWSFRNIHFDPKNRRTVLVDYGLVYHSNLVDKNSFGGSPSSLAPECWPSNEVISGKTEYVSKFSEASDLYGIACLLYRLIEGRLPYSLPSLKFLFARDAHQKQCVLPMRNFFMPDVLINIVLDLLQKDPDMRVNYIENAKCLFEILEGIEIYFNFRNSELV